MPRPSESKSTEPRRDSLRPDPVSAALGDALGAAVGGDLNGAVLAINVAIERYRYGYRATPVQQSQRGRGAGVSRHHEHADTGRQRMRADDRRRSCWCGHRYGDHARGGTRCLAANDETPGGFCPCQRWMTGEMIDAKRADTERFHRRFTEEGR